MSGTKWTDKEDEILIRHFVDSPWSELLEMLPNRTYDAINYHARRILGLSRRGASGRSDTWTEEEDAILKEHYVSMSWDRLLNLLPKRTKQAIYNRAFALGLDRQASYSAWTEEEDAILKECYETADMDELYELLPERTKGSITSRAFKLGLSKNRTASGKDETTERSNTWTEEEDTILKKHYPTMKVTELTRLLPTRTFYAIQTRASKLELSKIRGGDLRIRQWERDILLEMGPSVDIVSLKLLIPERSLSEIQAMQELIVG